MTEKQMEMLQDQNMKEESSDFTEEPVQSEISDAEFNQAMEALAEQLGIDDDPEDTPSFQAGGMPEKNTLDQLSEEFFADEKIKPVEQAEGGTTTKEDYDVESSTDLRNLVAKKLGTYDESEVARSEARRLAESENLGTKGADTLRHILGSGYLKYIDKDQFPPFASSGA